MKNESEVYGFLQGNYCQVYGTIVLNDTTVAGTNRLNIFEFKSNVFPDCKNLNGVGRTPGSACVYLGDNLGNEAPPADVQSVRLILAVNPGTFSVCVKFWTSVPIPIGTDIRIGWSTVYEVA